MREPGKLALALTLCLITTPAVAEMPCGAREEALKNLGEKFKESPVSGGITLDGTLIEVLTSPDGSTWTIMLTYERDGKKISCLLSAGEEWHDLEHVPSGQPL